MKIQVRLNFIAKVLLLSGTVWLSGHTHATTCDSSANPIIISSNCSDLVVSNTKSAISLDLGIAIDGAHGLLIQTTNGNVGMVTVNAGSQIIGTVFSGIDNEGTITNLNNSYLIQGVGNGISNFNTIGAINNNNSGAVISGDDQGITNFSGARIGSLVNSGAISAANNYGVYNLGAIDVLRNNFGGTIQGQLSGIYNGGSIATLNNVGTISSGVIGVYNLGKIDTLANSGSITVGLTGSGIGNNGTINTLNNTGNITAGLLGWGVENYGTITILNNAKTGSITAGSGGDGILNGGGGIITSLTNFGSISAGGIVLENYGAITALNNSGSMTTDGGNVISNSNYIGNINNLGLISSDGGSGISNIGTIDVLQNLGKITIGDSALYGIYNIGTITDLTNLGSITAGLNPQGAIYNDAQGHIGNLKNGGLITVGDFGTAIVNKGAIAALNNLGEITVGNTSAGIVTAGGGINTLTNAGRIKAGASGTGIGIDSATGSFINILNNTGSIVAGDGGSAIFNGGSINTLSNTGSLISGDGNFALQNNGVLSNLINAGQITAGQFTSGVGNYGTINVLTNIGAINAGNNSFGIDNSGTIATLNNSQGGNSSSPGTTALTYNGNVPANYNIVIVSPAHYGQLAVNPTGTTVITNFGIYGAPFLTSRTYASVLTNNATVTNLQGTYDNMTLTLVDNGATYDLTFTGASLMGTQQSLVNTANALAPIYTLQNSILANSFTYDCTEFGVNNICISAGGRNVAVSAANGLNNSSALLIGAYRPHPNYRIGAYVDQNLSVNNSGSTVNLGNNTPLIGLFGAWNERLDGTGTEVKVSAAYGQKNATVTRQVVGLSEPGSGSSQLNSQGAQIAAKYGFGVIENVIVSPYIGMRYTQNNMNGYTEGASSSVTAPLTYAALNTNATTALAGVGVSYKVVPQVITFVSAGVETDTNTVNGTYSAIGINGLNPVNFNPNPVKTRPTATLGVYYDIVKNQRLGITGIYRQEPFQSVTTTTVMATYTVGL